MPSEDVIKAFKKFDKDGNGVISRSELSMVSRQMKQRTSDEAENVMWEKCDMLTCRHSCRHSESMF